MTDDTPTTPTDAPGQERSWAPETGWPDASTTPSWSEVEALQETSDEEGLDAWLDAQDGTLDAAEPEPADEPADAGPDAHAHPEPAHPEPADAEPAHPEPADAEPAHPEPSDVDADVDADTDTDADVDADTDTDPELPDAELPDAEGAHPAPAYPEPALAPVARADADEGVAGELLADQDTPEAVVAAVPATRSGRLAVALMVVLVLLLSGLTAFLAERSVSTRGGGGVEQARRDALQAARNAARLVFSYDYRHLDKDFAAGKAVTTGKFGEQYGTTTPKLVSVATTYKAVVVADVSDAAVISAAKDRVVVLVFVNQQSTSTLSAAPKITQSRLTMTLVERGDRWLVSEVNAF